jgi:uncharacterized protein YacL
MHLSRSLSAILRLTGGVIFGLIGWAIADVIPANLISSFGGWVMAARLALAVMGAALGIWFFPRLIGRPANAVIEYLLQVNLGQLGLMLVGLIAGLLVAALVAFPLAQLPSPFNQVLPVLVAILCGYLGVMLVSARFREIVRAIGQRIPAMPSFRGGKNQPAALPITDAASKTLLDTSVLIDGRVADIAATGFLRGELVIPRFVLNELQYVADSMDGLRRARGKRGLDVVKQLQTSSKIPVVIIDEDITRTRLVDEKLVLLAKQMDCPIMTNDYNLNKVASIQGVSVLNINELANAVKVVVLPGEPMSIHVIQPGKEPSQGVGYLEDGTMVVIEGGSIYLDRSIDITVTKVLQTAAGRMIFAKPEIIKN